MFNTLIIVVGKLARWTSHLLNLGHGSTWPGHIALETNKHFIKEILAKNPQLKIILIAGTNGKTTTGKMIQTILEKDGRRVFQNQAGANLLNGIASTLIRYCNVDGGIDYDYAIFEVDENTLPLAVEQNTPVYIIILNLFRDQLDRYGEVDTIANKWKKALEHLNKKTKVILNADDPMIVYIGKGLKNEVLYFGLSSNTSKKVLQHAVDTIHCPNCGSRLSFSKVFISHLGEWECKVCQFSRPKPTLSFFTHFPLPGLYNQYNTLAAVLLANTLKVPSNRIVEALAAFQPAFGRQEIIQVNGKRAQLFLSKNPASFNESLRTVQELNAKHILLVLNDRIPDGRDVSWIWDVDFEEFINKNTNIIVSGDRCFDMGLRIKYASSYQVQSSIRQLADKSQNQNSKIKILQDLREAIGEGLKSCSKSETLYILPTYSAMLEVRKILTGKSIP